MPARHGRGGDRGPGADPAGRTGLVFGVTGQGPRLRKEPIQPDPVPLHHLRQPPSVGSCRARRCWSGAGAGRLYSQSAVEWTADVSQCLAFNLWRGGAARLPRPGRAALFDGRRAGRGLSLPRGLEQARRALARSAAPDPARAGWRRRWGRLRHDRLRGVHRRAHLRAGRRRTGPPCARARRSGEPPVPRLPAAGRAVRVGLLCERQVGGPDRGHPTAAAGDRGGDRARPARSRAAVTRRAGKPRWCGSGPRWSR